MPPSQARQIRCRSERLTSRSTKQSTTRCCSAWKLPSAWPNCLRVFRWSSVRPSALSAQPHQLDAGAERQKIRDPRRQFRGLKPPRDDPRRIDRRVVESHLPHARAVDHAGDRHSASGLFTRNQAEQRLAAALGVNQKFRGRRRIGHQRDRAADAQPVALSPGLRAQPWRGENPSHRAVAPARSDARRAAHRARQPRPSRWRGPSTQATPAVSIIGTMTAWRPICSAIR